jgi:hypothetical protein
MHQNLKPSSFDATDNNPLLVLVVCVLGTSPGIKALTSLNASGGPVGLVRNASLFDENNAGDSPLRLLHDSPDDTKCFWHWHSGRRVDPKNNTQTQNENPHRLLLPLRTRF